MIYISGQPFDPAALLEEYPPESAERTVLAKMRESESGYRFDSVDQLKFELRLRAGIVDAARRLDRSGFDFAVFLKSRCNPNFWEKKENGGWLLKDGVSPAAAIRDILTNGRAYATECATAMVIVLYKALLEIFSDERFDRLFPRIYLMNWHSLDRLIREFGDPGPAADILPGDRAYFANPDVDPQTPEWQGENVIVLPGGLYYGHGVGIRTAPQIIAELNRNRAQSADQSAYFLDTVSRPDYRRLFGVYVQNPAPAAGMLDWRAFAAGV